MHSTHPGHEAERDGVRAHRGPGRHLAIALILKLVLLTLLWHAFIKPHRVTIDDTTMGAHLSGISQPHLENRHDRRNGR